MDSNLCLLKVWNKYHLNTLDVSPKIAFLADTFLFCSKGVSKDPAEKGLLLQEGHPRGGATE